VESLSDKQVRMVACGAEHTSCTVVHGWVPDEEARACMACKKMFTTVKRRVSGGCSVGQQCLYVHQNVVTHVSI